MDLLRKKRALLLAFALLSGTATGATFFSRPYSFERPVITLAEGFSRIELQGAAAFTRTGAPVVPCLLVTIPLPTEMEDLGLEIEPAGLRAIPLPAPPEFGRPPRSLAPNSVSPPEAGPDPAYYATDAFYPATYGEVVSIQRSRGKSFALIRLHPVRVNPLAGELQAAGTLSVRLTSPTPARLGKRLAAPPPDASWRYLLITTNSLLDAFAPLAESKREAGTTVEVKSVDELYRTYPGEDGPAKIRACIKDGYEHHGTEFVLLGGDVDAVPVRGAYGRVDKYIDQTIPSDLYYGCLDGTWDGNGNGVYGEPDDGEGGQDVDLFSEVYVGRAPVETPAEASAFVAKTIRYGSSPHPLPGRVLLAAEFLGATSIDNKNFYPQGGEHLDTLLPYFTGYELHWLDDRPRNAYTWTGKEMAGELNANPNLVCHFGHGNPERAMRLGTGDCHSLRNTFPFHLHSIACDAGWFDADEECFGEAIVNHGHGAVSAVLNTRHGWFDPIWPSRYSGEFQKGYVREAIRAGRPIGEALARAREALAGQVEGGGEVERPYRWAYYTSTLFGDPQLVIQPSRRWHVSPTNGTSRMVLLHRDAKPHPVAFSLRNLDDGPIDWSVDITPPLLVPSVSGGTLQAKGETGLELSIDTGRIPSPGSYESEVCFTSSLSTTPYTFKIELEVLAMPRCTETLGAPDDALLPFGDISAGLEGPQAFLRIENLDSRTGLVVDKITIDGRDCTMTGSATDLICYDGRSGGFFSLQAEEGSDLRPIPMDHFYGIGALEVVPDRPNTLYAINYLENTICRFGLPGCELVDGKEALPGKDRNWSGLAYHERDGVLYATATDAQTTMFYRIDPDTLTPTPLGETAVDVILIAIAIDGDGTLFAIDGASDTLVKADPFSGAIEVVGPLGIDANYSQGLDFTPRGADLLWASFTGDYSSELRRIDPRTGSSKVLRTFPENASGITPELEFAVLPSLSPYRLGSDGPLVIPPGQAASIPVSFLPDRIGDYPAEIALYAKDARRPFATFACTGSSSRASACPFAWLQGNGLPLDGTADGLDLDGDGFTNAEEWCCGTDPNDPASRLHIKGCEVQEGGLVFTWPASPGLVYTLLQSDRLTPPTFAPVKSVLAKGPEISATVPVNRTNSFYRIQIGTGD